MKYTVSLNLILLWDAHNRFLAKSCSSRCLRLANTCSSWILRLSFSATAWLNFRQNWWNILKHSSILNVLPSSQKNSASDRLNVSSSSMSRFNWFISCSAIYNRVKRTLRDTNRIFSYPFKFFLFSRFHFSIDS